MLTKQKIFVLLPHVKDGKFPFALTEEDTPTVETETLPIRQGTEESSYQRVRNYIDDVIKNEDVIETDIGEPQDGFLHRNNQEEDNLGAAEMRHVQQQVNLPH
jgi:hypothetical protein